MKTRLLRGKISYDEKDVKVRLEGWTASRKMADNLLREWQTINSVDLSVYRENKTGKQRTVVVRDLESPSKGALGRCGLASVRERVADGQTRLVPKKTKTLRMKKYPVFLSAQVLYNAYKVRGI